MNNEGDDVRSGRREKEKNKKKKTRGVQYLLRLLAEGEKLETFILTPLLLPRRYKLPTVGEPSQILENIYSIHTEQPLHAKGCNYLAHKSNIDMLV